MTDQTQDPPKGQGQEGQQPSEELKKLQDQMADLQKQLQAKDREVKANQARADRAEAAVAGAKSPVAPTGRTVPTAMQQRVQQQQAAQQVAQPHDEVMMLELQYLREISRRGLNIQDVDLEFKNPDGTFNFAGASDLSTKLDLWQQKNEIAELRKSLEAQKQQAAGEGQQSTDTSSTQVDTGGQTGALGQQQVQVENFRKTAKDLRGKGMYREATWVALRAAYTDPGKRMQVRPDSE